MNRILLSGNEAIARGCFEAGCGFATGYPGTPSTEILESIARYAGIYTNWAVNEKVALETASGACLAGARSIVTMKHVGLNVASDPLMTLAYTGVGAGLVVVSADDPGIHSSQNEQDNRWYALMAKIPMLEPSDSEAARIFTKKAFEISELFDLPVLLRVTTRISHSKTVVYPEEPEAVKKSIYPEKAIEKYVMVPANARKARLSLEGRFRKLVRFSEQCSLNTVESGSTDYGIITSGISYQYVKEVMPHANILKLALTNPLPLNLIKAFVERFAKILIVEELDPYIEMQIRHISTDIHGKDFIPSISELTPEKVREGIRKFTGGTNSSVIPSVRPALDVIRRPPILCPGCPHRGLFYQLSKQRTFIAGDIGCYTLAYDEPLKAVHTCLDMGAGIGQAMGIEKAMPTVGKKPVAVIGDSTFLHSGMTSLLNVVYNRSNILIVILDNRTTAMTGAQANPLSGTDIHGNPSPDISLEQIVSALGVTWVRTVNPYETKLLEKTIKEAIAFEGPAVIITKAPCVLLPEFKKNRPRPFTVKTDLCTGCTICLNIDCPSLWWEPSEVKAAGKKRAKGIAYIDPVSCTGCGLCADVCSFDAIVKLPGTKDKSPTQAELGYPAPFPKEGIGGITQSSERDITVQGKKVTMSASTVVTGVGGQGVVSATDIISIVALKAGYEVKKSDVHGMAQRGGAVTSFVRYGNKVYSPIIEQGTADYLIALEEMEALRGIVFLKDNGTVILSDFHTPPPDVALGYKKYPEHIQEQLKAIKPAVKCYRAGVIDVLKQHPTYSINMFLLGIYAYFQSYEKMLWLEAIRQRFKRSDRAIESFLYGYEKQRKEML